jgi:N-acetylglucosaminyl-diphospho-decaprenol L-rhamnosyltransferase
MRLLIVIVNYRTADLTVDCLRSVAPQITSGMGVVITDNLSGDDSVRRIGRAIEANHWEWATVMPLQRNGGFAFGNNAAIRAGLASDDPPEFVLLLNPDTILREHALASLMEFMQRRPEVGIAGSRLEDPDGTPQISAFRFHSIASEFERGIRLGPVSKLLASKMVAQPVPSGEIETDWVAGASMIIRAQGFSDVARASRPCRHGQDARVTEFGLDEKYFMYFEEVDFCMAAKRAGWKIGYVPSSRVIHLVGAASELSDARKHRKRRPTYWFDSRRRYFVKNSGVLYACLADAAFAIGFSLWRLRRFVQQKEDRDPPQMLGDFVRNSIFVRGASL